MDHTWTCACCGQTFDSLPMDYAIEGPANWFAIPEAERAARVEKDSNLCVIDEREFYVRGCIEVPVHGCDEVFVWGVWVSVSEASFRHVLDKWTAEIADDEPPRFGWLCNWIRGYPEPEEVACDVHLRSGNLRPRIVLEATDYPLAIEQRQGITLERVKEIVASAGH